MNTLRERLSIAAGLFILAGFIGACCASSRSKAHVTVLRDCCVFCSYGTVKCPPVQIDGVCRK